MFPLNSVFKAYLSQSVEAQNIMINSSPASAWLTLESDPCFCTCHRWVVLQHTLASKHSAVFPSENNLLQSRARFGSLTCCEAFAALCTRVFICLWECFALLHRGLCFFLFCELGACFWGYLHTFHWSVQVNAATHSCQWWRLIILRI